MLEASTSLEDPDQILAAGDIICQKIQQRKLVGRVDWKRAGRFSIVGLCIHGPFFLYGFKWLDTVIKGEPSIKTVRTPHLHLLHEGMVHPMVALDKAAGAHVEAFSGFCRAPLTSRAVLHACTGTCKDLPWASDALSCVPHKVRRCSLWADQQPLPRGLTIVCVHSHNIAFWSCTFDAMLLPSCSSYSCLVALQLLEGKTAQQALDKVKSVLVPTMVAGAVFWPAANLLSKCRWATGTGTQGNRARSRSVKWPMGQPRPAYIATWQPEVST